MGLYDLCDRINWIQACRILGVSKSTLYRMVEAGIVRSYGVGARNRFFLKSELLSVLDCDFLLYKNNMRFEQGGNEKMKA